MGVVSTPPSTLELITAPSVEPVTLAQAKQYARVEITDDDSLITTLITVARKAVEKEARQALITQTWKAHYDQFPFSPGYYNRTIRQMGVGPLWLPQQGGGVFQLPLPPLISVSSITYYDSNNTFQTIDPSIYNVAPGLPGRVQPVFGKVWPIAAPIINAVQITFVAGYGPAAANVPEPATLAILRLVFDWYNRRSPVGVLSADVRDLVSAFDHGSYV